MEIIEMARMTSKGQVPVPAPIREVFNLKKGSTVVFKVTDNGHLARALTSSSPTHNRIRKSIYGRKG